MNVNLLSLDVNELDLAVSRELCKRDFYEFVKQAWPHIDPNPFVDNWHIEVVARHLEAITFGKIRNLVINISPGCMKSMLVSVLWPAWEWIHKPGMRYISTSHSQSFSTRDTRKSRMLIESEWYQARWPIQMSGDQNSKTNYENTSMGYRECKAFTSLTGSRGNRVIIDDPISVDGAASEAERENVNTTFLEAVPSRINNPITDSIIIIMQRLHEQDIVGVINERGLDYEQLIIPMEYTGVKKFTTSLNMEDPRTEIGELMFPARLPRSEIDNLKKSLGPFGWSAQFMQDAIPRTDGFFDMITLENNRYSDNELPRREELNVYITSDHAPSGTGDNNVVRVWGVDYRNHKWLLDSFVDKCDMSQAMGITTDSTGRMIVDKRGALALIRKWKPLYWFPEHDNNWRSIEPTVKMAMNTLPDAFCRIRPLPTTGSKEQKATAYDSAIRMGTIHLPRTSEGDATINEYRTFPVGKHDDRIDADAAICRAESAYPGTIQLPISKKKVAKDYEDQMAIELEDHQGGFFS